MKKYIITLVTFIILISSGFYYYLYSQKNMVECGGLVNGTCYHYKCLTGTIKPSIGGSPNCSDGSRSIQVEEVDRDVSR